MNFHPDITEMVETARRNGKPLVHSARDGQRQKAYDAERVLSKHATRMSAEHLEALLFRIVNNPEVRRKYGQINPKLRMTRRGATTSRGGRYSIAIAPGHMTDWILIHEVAHSYTHHIDPGHDWLWAIVYLDLVKMFMGDNAYADLKQAFRRGKVRHTVPKPKRQASPAQKARMAKARAARQADSVEPHAFLVRDTWGRFTLIKSESKRWGVRSFTACKRDAVTRASGKGIADLVARNRWQMADRIWAVPVSALPDFLGLDFDPASVGVSVEPVS